MRCNTCSKQPGIIKEWRTVEFFIGVCQHVYFPKVHSGPGLSEGPGIVFRPEKVFQTLTQTGQICHERSSTGIRSSSEPAPRAWWLKLRCLEMLEDGLQIWKGHFLKYAAYAMFPENWGGTAKLMVCSMQISMISFSKRIFRLHVMFWYVLGMCLFFHNSWQFGIL